MPQMADGEWTAEDRFSPIYCVQCRKQIPAALSQKHGGVCGECDASRSATPVPAPPADATPPSAADEPATKQQEMHAPTDSPPPNANGHPHIGGIDALMSAHAAPYAVPDAQLGGWNWGAFAFTFIWGLNHKAYSSLLALVPGLWLPVAIWSGIQGNRWAWESGRFESMEDMRSCQAIWRRWAAVILFAIPVILWAIPYSITSLLAILDIVVLGFAFAVWSGFQGNKWAWVMYLVTVLPVLALVGANGHAISTMFTEAGDLAPDAERLVAEHLIVLCEAGLGGGLLVAAFAGVKGMRVAWDSRRFATIEQMHEFQAEWRTWAIAWWVSILIFFIVYFLR